MKFKTIQQQFFDSVYIFRGYQPTNGLLIDGSAYFYYLFIHLFITLKKLHIDLYVLLSALS